jgi:hypothetical protein
MFFPKLGRHHFQHYHDRILLIKSKIVTSYGKLKTKIPIQQKGASDKLFTLDNNS